MEKKPMISVIVPVYQVQEYLEPCLDSIVNQTYQNLEIILIDDGSTDNSGKICDKYAGNDARIKVIHKKNGGISSARNAGLKIAEGELIGFVDSDDWIDPDMFSYLQSVLAENSADIVTCAAAPESLPDKQNTVTVLDMESAMSSLLDGGKVDNSVWNKLYTRNVWDGVFFPEGMILEDAATIYKCILKAKRIVVTEYPCYHYRIRQGSILHTAFTKKNFDGVKASKSRLDDICIHAPVLKQKAANAYVWTVLYYIWWADHAAHGKYNKERQEIADEMLEYLDNNSDIIVNSRVSRNKIALLRMGLPVYDFVWRIYHRVLKCLQR